MTKLLSVRPSKSLWTWKFATKMQEISELTKLKDKAKIVMAHLKEIPKMSHVRGVVRKVTIPILVL